MTNTTMKKIILSATTAMFLTACGSSSSTSAADKASAKIQAYATSNTNPKPTVADYVAAGVTGVTAANLDAYNALVDAKTAADVDTVAELNDLVKHISAADTEAPVIHLTGDAAVTITVGDSYTDAGATVTDNKDTGLTVTLSGDTVNTAAAGTYTIKYNVTDAAGNAATEVTRTVTVSAVADTEAPVVTPAAATVTVAFGGTYTDGGATVTDNVDTGLTATSSGTVDTNTAGDYTITYSATDAAGNTGTATTVVTVNPQFSTANGLVTDSKTGLVWNDAVTNIATGTCPTGMTTPTLKELQTILDYGRKKPAINEALSAIVTSLTTVPQRTVDGWDVSLDLGFINNITDSNNTICVNRTNSTIPDANFTKSDDNVTVTDNNTGLVWQYAATNTLETYTEAVAKCTGDWRLPTITELYSIYNTDTNTTDSAFDNSNAAYFWTDTRYSDNNDYLWTVHSTSGLTYIGKDTVDKARTRCVK